MTRFTNRLRPVMQLICLPLTPPGDGMRFLLLCLSLSPALAAETLFLRRQLVLYQVVLYQERCVKPRRVTHTTCMPQVPDRFLLAQGHHRVLPNHFLQEGETWPKI
jgi:hypothetical protein